MVPETIFRSTEGGQQNSAIRESVPTRVVLEPQRVTGTMGDDRMS